MFEASENTAIEPFAISLGLIFLIDGNFVETVHCKDIPHRKSIIL
jgi:hypothetical protein